MAPRGRILATTGQLRQTLLKVAAEDADPETIKLVAGAIRDHADKIAEVHGAMGAYTADFAASFDVLPYHPAAAEAMGITQ